MSKTTWQPWIDFRSEVVEATLPIPQPPCPDCLFWNPQRKYIDMDIGFQFDGVVCCHSSQQEKDFSCFFPREGGDNP